MWPNVLPVRGVGGRGGRCKGAGCRPGVVYQTANRKEADFTLTFVESAKQADFSLWIVDDSTKAGWRNKGKEHLLDKYLKK